MGNPGEKWMMCSEQREEPLMSMLPGSSGNIGGDLKNVLASVQGIASSVLPLNGSVNVVELLMISREQAVSRAVLSPVSGVRQDQGVDRGSASIWAEWVSSGALGGPCGEGVGKAGLWGERGNTTLREKSR